MNKTTSALKLAEEALVYHTQQTRPIQKTDEALAAIREAIAEQSMSMVLNDPHPPHRLCECTACLEYWTPLPDCDAFAASGKVITEPVQEPVAYFLDVKAGCSSKPFYEQVPDEYKNDADVFPLYASPVSVKRERYFCERCGKRVGDNNGAWEGVHTCTPPEDTKRLK